jgi:hypothetical protein
MKGKFLYAHFVLTPLFSSFSRFLSTTAPRVFLFVPAGVCIQIKRPSFPKNKTPLSEGGAPKRPSIILMMDIKKNEKENEKKRLPSFVLAFLLLLAYDDEEVLLN